MDKQENSFKELANFCFFWAISSIAMLIILDATSSTAIKCAFMITIPLIGIGWLARSLALRIEAVETIEQGNLTDDLKAAQEAYYKEYMS